MKAIKSDQIKTLKRRRDFLVGRVSKRGEMKGGDYDLEEISALDTAINYLEFIVENVDIMNKIRVTEQYDNIIKMSNKGGNQ